MLLPATTVGEPAVFVSVTKAELVAAPTTVLTVAELFARLGSLVPDEIFAVSTICVPNAVAALTIVTNVNVPVPLAPLGRSGSVQVMFPVDRIEALELHAQPVGTVMD